MKRFSALMSIVLANLAAWAVHGRMPAGPALALGAELTWTPVYAGDPLRVRVFLSSPLMFEESLDLVRQIEQGEVPPGDPDPQADHLGRLAFAAYVGGNHFEARRLGTKALQRDPGNLQPDRLETHLLVARSALAAQDYAGAKAALDLLASHPGAENLGEVLELVRARLESLAPRLRLFPATPGAGSLRLELDAFPGQRYVTYESADLRSWLPLSTNLSLTNWITLPDLPASEGSPRFYRSIMQP